MYTQPEKRGVTQSRSIFELQIRLNIPWVPCTKNRNQLVLERALRYTMLPEIKIRLYHLVNGSLTNSFSGTSVTTYSELLGLRKFST